MPSTKTTLHLPNELRVRLKKAAAERGTTLSALVVEGAEIVLARAHMARDKQDLTERAARAWERLRGGLFSHGAVADHVDTLVYGLTPPAKPARPRRARKK